MAWYCSTCGSKLKSQKVKNGSEETRTGTQRYISHKVLIVKTIRRYVCPNGCVLTRVTGK